MNNTDNENHIARRGHVIEVRLTPRQTPESLIALKKDIIELSRGQEYDILVDASRAETSSPEARAVAEGFFTGLPYKRYAFWGGTPPVNLGLKFLLDDRINPEHVRIFRREEDARAWLEESN